MSEVYRFDFRPQSIVDRFGEKHFAREGYKLVVGECEGEGVVELTDSGKIFCSYYVWNGDVPKALLTQAREIVGTELTWGNDNWYGNGHGGAELLIVDRDSITKMTNSELINFKQ